jgi:hypothetical protein
MKVFPHTRFGSKAHGSSFSELEIALLGTHRIVNVVINSIIVIIVVIIIPPPW